MSFFELDAIYPNQPLVPQSLQRCHYFRLICETATREKLCEKKKEDKKKKKKKKRKKKGKKRENKR